MRNLLLPLCLLLTATVACSPETTAQSTSESAFSTGPVIADYGPTAVIDADFKIPAGTKFKVSFDTIKTTEPGEINRSLNTLARFLNMHAKAGVAEEDMELAIVFHSKAVIDLTNAARYGEEFDGAQKMRMPRSSKRCWEKTFASSSAAKAPPITMFRTKTCSPA